MSRKLKSLVDVGCLVRVAEDTPLVAARQAIAMAAAHEAHLLLTLAVQTFSAPYSPFWSGVSASIAREINDKAVQRAQSLAEALKAEVQSAGVSGEVEIIAGALGEISARGGDTARAVDLVVVDQPHGALDSSEAMLEEALFRSGRPVLVAAPDQAPFGAVKKIVLGWDGSAHAVRAGAEALSLFASLEEIEVVTVSGERKRTASLPAESYTRHLARKGVKATLTELPLGDATVAAVLGAQAKKSGADLIAMGAFGHSRLREFLLGGTTVELTSGASLGLLLVG